MVVENSSAILAGFDHADGSRIERKCGPCVALPVQDYSTNPGESADITEVQERSTVSEFASHSIKGDVFNDFRTFPHELTENQL